MLKGVDIVALDEDLGRRAGVLLAADGDELVTSDPEDLTFLASAAGAHVELNLV